MLAKRTRINLICVVVIITVFSQITTIDRFSRPAMYASWVFLLAVGLIANHFRIRLLTQSKHYILMIVCYVVYCIICSILGGEHLNSGYMRLLPIPLLIMIVADLFWQDYDEWSIRRIAIIYTLSVLIFSIWIHYTFFASYSSWLSFRGGYLFSTKNSAAQTISPAIYMIFFLIIPKENNNKNKLRFVWYLIVLYLLFILGLSQARTSLLGLTVSLTLYAFRYSKRRLQWIIALLAVGFIAMQFSVVRGFVQKVFNVQKYADADLNTITSGRVAQYTKAARAFFESPIIGHGKWYVDCSFLSILTESGIIGFLIVEPLWVSKIITNIRSPWYDRNHIGRNKRDFIVLLTAFYFVESCFEAYPPFGPGVTSFGFWFFCEMIMCYGMNNSKSINGVWQGDKERNGQVIPRDTMIYADP